MVQESHDVLVAGTIQSHYYNRAMDVRTLYSIVGVVFFITPIAVLYALRSYRDRAVWLWCGSWLAFGITALLIAARDLIPGFLSFHVAHIFFAGSYVARTVSITWELSDTRQAWRRSLTIRAYLLLRSLNVPVCCLFKSAVSRRLLNFLSSRFNCRVGYRIGAAF